VYVSRSGCLRSTYISRTEYSMQTWSAGLMSSDPAPIRPLAVVQSLHPIHIPCDEQTIDCVYVMWCEEILNKGSTRQASWQAFNTLQMVRKRMLLVVVLRMHNPGEMAAQTRAGQAPTTDPPPLLFPGICRASTSISSSQPPSLQRC
jgi:hypothetical protein